MPTFDLTKLLNPKNWLYLAGLILAIFLAVKGYNWIWDRGYAKHVKETAVLVKGLTKERDDAIAAHKLYKDTYETWVANTKKAQEQYLKEQLADLAARQARMEQAEREARNKPTTIKEVIRYVPAQVDAAYKLPVGLVRLYSETLQGSTTAYSGAGLPQGNAIDVGEASSLAVSQFGQIAAANNAECVVRGKVIEEWQSWYQLNKARFDQLQTQQSSTGPAKTP